MDRISVDQKQTINCRADLNQLVPIKYDWAWGKYLESIANFWSPAEISMSADIKLWKSNKLTDQERKVVKQSLGFFSTADSLVANNIVFAVYKYVTNPECRQYLLSQAYQEGLHSFSYLYCIQSLGMNEGELFNMYREIPSVSAKAEWALEHTQELSDPDFKTGTVETDSAFLKNLIAYYCVLEGLFFYAGFSLMFSLGRRNLMTGVSEQFQYILRDESHHVGFGIELINQIKAENKHLWTTEFKADCYKMILEACELEIAYARDTVGKGITGMKLTDLENYLKFITDRRLKQIGLKAQFNIAESPFPWLSELIDLRKEKNFFETRVTDYQAGGALSWD